jgi:hypothetical protein
MQYLYGHNSLETAYIVEDYPWGFRLRTKMRYWIESKKGQGQRIVSQSMNPKTGLWCAPKKSTYHSIAILYLDEFKHVHWEALSLYSSAKDIESFKDTHFEELDDFQTQYLKEIMAYEKVMRNVTCTCEIVQPGAKDREERQKEQAQTFENIKRAISFEMSKIPF